MRNIYTHLSGYVRRTKAIVAITLMISAASVAYAQPGAISTNGFLSGYNCQALNDLGAFRQARFQATSSGSGTWEFPATCAFPGDVWRPYGGGTGAVAYNTFIAPVGGTGSALYNSFNGGSSGNAASIVSGRYYTFNVQDVASGVNANMAILETTYDPVVINAVSNTASVAGMATTVTITMASVPNAGENVFVRYSTDGFTTSTLVAASFAGAVGTASIPAFSAGTNVAYYVLSSPVTPTHTTADMLTLRLNNNGGSNYNYTVSSNPVVVNATGGTASASYATLKAAFDAINAGTHTGTIAVQIAGNTTETATAALNGSGTGSASYSTISIQPAGGAARTVSGAIAAGSPLISFDGADNVTVDGLNSGGNSLTFSNTTVSSLSGTSTIRFQSDATNNTITKCSVLGSATMAVGTNGGNISFQSSAISTGNDNNTISFCDLGPAGANLPSKCIHFSGTSNTDPGTANSGIVITGNNIFDYFSATVASAGIDLNSGTVGTTISNNKFYQTATRTQTTGSQHNAIRISNSSGNGYQVTGNTIGFASSAGTGTYTLVGVSSSSVFIPIFLSVGTTTASSIQGNTIAGINFSGAISGTSSSASFRGIYVSSGLTTVGDITGNTIGSMSTTGSIVVSSSSTTAADVIGMFNFGTSNWTTNNNNIGGITASNSSTGAINIYGLRCNTGSSATWTCSNNTIGGTVANSINSTSTAIGTIVNGIRNELPIGTITGNIIRNMTVAGGTGTTTSASMIGIAVTTSSTNQTIAQNSIFNLSNSNTTAATVVTGIQFNGSTTNVVERNLIYGLTAATNSTTAEINGIRIAGGTTTYRNNMIALGAGVSNAIGSAASNSGTSGIVGINEALGTNNIWHNNIYIGGTATAGTGASYAFNGVQTTNTRSFRDNIFVNARTNSGASGKHYAVKINGTVPNPTGLTINNNLYYTSGSGGVFGFFNSADVADLTAWKAAVGQDAASFSSDPQYLNPTASTPDLHIHPSNPTSIEGNGFDVGVVLDYDGQTRSSFSPVDIGADAGNFVSAGDISAPVITYTPLAGTCTTVDRTVTATITDATGVPTTGPLVPRIYFRKNAGSYVSAPGTLTTGTGTSGTWDFVISAAALGGLAGGELINYYIIAQDLAGTPNIASSPGGVVATDVNTVTTHPASPNAYSIGISSGTFTVGVGGNFTSLTAAVSAYNAGCISGPIVFNLTDATYPSETFPITINAVAGSSSTNTLTIKPAATATISGSSANAIIRLNGADYVILDGSNSGGTDRSLTITNTNTGAATAAIWLSSTGVGAGATNNTIKNLNISCGADQSTSTNATFGIIANGAVSITSTAPNQDNDNNTYQNNAITAVRYGIVSIGEGSANPNQNTLITGNLIGPAAFGTAQIGKAGVVIQNENLATISSNEVRFVGVLFAQTAGGTDRVGIAIATDGSWTPSSTAVTNSRITRNHIHDIVDEKTFSAAGIAVASSASPSNNTVDNNMIYNVRANGTAGDQAVGIGISAGNGDLITYNAVRMSGDMDPAGTTTASQSAVGIRVSSTSVTNPTIKNNIAYADVTSNTGTLKHYAVVTPTSYAFGTGSANNNDYYINAANTQMVIGGSGTSIPYTDRTTLSAWQTSFTPSQDLNSITTDPNFVSATDLHINTTTLSPVDNTGTPVAVTTDYDGETRSVSTPDIGLDEMTSCLNITVYADSDGDSYGDPAVTAIDCDGGAPPTGYVTNSTDCDDTNAAINPTTLWYLDADGDLYSTGGAVTSCTSPGVGYAYTGLTGGGDCNDADAAINPGATEICNAIDDDCDGSVDEGLIFTTYYADADSDTYGDAAVTTTSCAGIPSGYVADNTDCDDTNAAINPAATEICDGVDNDCDGLTDEGVLLTFYADADGDAFGDAAVTTSACSAPTGYVANSNDCDDTDAAVNPAATEACNGIDDDCDGFVDEAGALGEATWFADADGDGYGDAAVSVTACDAPVGYVGANDDCNDGNAAINPGATEICDGIDNDCDGSTDEGVLLTFYADVDGDTYGDAASTTLACSAPTGYVADNTDCNDGNAAINPAATEICDGIDNDCDGSTDEGVLITFYADVDGDTYGDAAATTLACSAPAGYVADNTDCDDTNAAINPTTVWYLDADGDLYYTGTGTTSCTSPGAGYAYTGLTGGGDCNDAVAAINPAATEVCDGVDNDCDGNIDEGVLLTFYADADGDTYGDAASTTLACSAPVGYVSDNTDCNDGNAAINPAATEICDGIDNDCDGSTDEGVLLTFYADTDGDTFGDAASTTLACSAPTGYVADNTDCNDANATVYPTAPELCDGLDNDCDGSTDEGLTFYTYYADAEGDGFGDPFTTTTSCSVTPPTGYVADNSDCQPAFITYADADGDGFGFGAPVPCGPVINNVDCDDTQLLYQDHDGDGYGAFAPVECGVANNTDCAPFNAAINPGATEICDGIDNDCDGSIDEGVAFTYYADVDGDTYGDPSVSTTACTMPVGYVTDNTDCNDANAAVNPAATEVCNGIDDDCDGSVDEGVLLTFYADADGDTYGDAATSTLACAAPVGYVADNTDCNDANAAVNPGATEACNGIDDDCDGSVDEGVLLTFYADADGDTFGDAAVSVTACAAPVGYVANNTDCDDTNPTVPVGALAGTFNIPSACFPTINSAVTALNTSGVGGAVTFNVAAGHTETAPVGGIALTATGTVTNTITFQKSGAGANPVINAFVGTSTPGSANQDGIFRLVGSDYVTIDGINLNDGNAANPATMEYGYGLFKASATDGAQNNTIRNSTITLNRVNNATGSGPAVDGSRGINMVNSTATAQTTALTVTAVSGANSNNKFYSNTIQNCNIGIAAIGFADVSPFTFVDNNNDIGGASAATGNIIRNFGGAAGATNPAAGIRTLAQYGLNVSYNTINNNDGGGVNHASTLRGIYTNTAANASMTISNNTVTLNGGGTTSQLSAIENVAGASGVTNVVNITNNTVQNSTYSTATSGTFFGIYNNVTSGGTATFNINNNVVANNSLPGTGNFTGMDGSSAGTTTVVNMNNNQVYGNTKTGASGSMFGMRAGTVNITMNGNTIRDNSFTANSGTSSSLLYGIYNLSSPINEVYTNNTVYNLSINGASTSTSHVIYAIYSFTVSTSVINMSGNTVYNITFNNSSTGAGAVNGIRVSSGGTTNVFRNKIYDITSNGASSTADGIRITGGTTHNIYNNLIGNISTPTANAAIPLSGIQVSGGTTANVYYNTVHLNASSTGALFGSAAMYASTTPNVTLRNNIFVNNSTPAGATGYTAAYRRTSTTLTSYNAASNNNMFYAGTPGANRVIFFDGTTTRITLADYQALVTTRDNASVTENPTFASLVGANANFLHFAAGATTLAESYGVNIAGITDDFDTNVRQGNPGYAGAGIAPDMGADEFEGVNPLLFPIDAGATVLVNPAAATTCFGAAQPVTVTIKNYGYLTLDMSVNPVTVTTTVTGPVGATLNATVSSGTLAPGATLDVVMAGTIDMTAPGVYTFNATAVVAGDGNTANDAMTAATRTSTNPTVSLAAATPVCEGDPIVLTATAAGGNLNLSYTGTNTTPATIPDNLTTGNSSTIVLSGPAATVGATTQIQVGVNVTGTFNSDVDLYLVGPAGCGTIELSTDNGSSGDGFNINLYNTGAFPSVTTLPTTGTPTGNFLMEGTVLTAPATLSATGGVNYPSVVYTAINGCPVNGTWTLFGGDDASGDVHTIQNWSLTITQPGVGTYTTAFTGPGTFGTTTYSGANNAVATTTVTGLTPGTYTFDAVATDMAGCSSAPSSTTVTVLANTTYYADADSDGFGDPAVTTLSCTGVPVGYVSDNTDCNDASATVYPGATEICGNGIDDDCDGSIDEFCTLYTFYADADGDTYGNAAVSVTNFTGIAPVGYVADNTDCDDTNASINPAATEICNGIDDDCDGSVDEGVLLTFYADADGDTYGDAATTTLACSAPTGYVADNTDCNDGNAAINPGAAEICNGIDDDCDGSIDEGLTFTTYYADADGDGYGDAAVTTTSCAGAPVGYVANADDCNDSDAAINPAATEICDGVDNDCDGSVDEGVLLTFYADADSDTYGDAATITLACSAPAGYVADNTDCNDGDAAINPGAAEICNGIDDDCDGSIDEGLTFTTYYADADGDGFGDAFATTTSCAGAPAGYVTDNTDCDDTQNTVYPGAPEICDGFDNDCDGDFDEGTVTATVTPSGVITICRGVPTPLTANTGVGYTYQWFKNGNVILGATSSVYNVTKPGYYQVQVNIPEGCFALSDVTTVQVYPNPNANISAPNGTSLCATVKLKASYDASYTWQWRNGGVPIPGATGYLYFPTTPGTYSCTITNAFGCSRTTATVTVTACKEGEETTTAVQESFELYPNPAENEFVLDMELNTTERDAQVIILNMVGAQVYAGTVGIDNGTIYQSIYLDDSTPSGMYIVKVLVADKEYTKQLVIQK